MSGANQKGPKLVELAKRFPQPLAPRADAQVLAAERYEFYSETLASSEIVQVEGRRLYLVFGHALVNEILKRPDDFSTTVSFGTAMTANSRSDSGSVDRWKRFPKFASNDVSVHRKLHLASAAALRGLDDEAIFEDSKRVAHDVLTELSGRGESVSLQVGFAQPYVGRVLARVLGLDPDDWPRWLEYGEAIRDQSFPAVLDRDEFDRSRQRFDEINEFLAHRLSAPDARRGGVLDLIGATSELELVEKIAVARPLFLGGMISTAGSVAALVAQVFGDRPVRGVKLEVDDFTAAALLPRVDEHLRLLSPVHGALRFARHCCEVGRIEVQKHDVFVLLFGAANRDPRVFDRPATFELGRARIRESLAFGAGIHSCTGARLARVELAAALAAFSERSEFEVKVVAADADEGLMLRDIIPFEALKLKTRSH